MKKERWLVTALLIVALTAAAGCSGNSGTENGSKSGNKDGDTPKEEASGNVDGNSDAPKDPYGRFDEPVTFTIGKMLPQAANFPEGSTDTVEDNEYTRYITEQLNVHIKHQWQVQGDAYIQKVNMSLASGDIPDAMVVSEDQLKQLVDADLIADLSDAYAQYASPYVKGVYDSTEGRALEKATFNGKLMALPDVNVQGNAPSLLWIRQDWLDKLNLQPPKTVDELEQVIKAFIERDPDGNNKNDTMGLPALRDIVSGAASVHFSLDTIFQAYGARPNMWVKDGDGQVIFGSIMPEMKTALGKLRDMYAQGLIDKEFGVKDVGKASEAVVSGKAGLMFGPWWSPFYPLNDAVKNDPKAEWRPYALPLDGNGVFNANTLSASSNFLVVHKGFKKPEAVVKTLNMQFKMIRVLDGAPQFYKGLNVNWAINPFSLNLDYANAVERIYQQIQDTLDGKTKPEDLQADRRTQYEQVVEEMKNPKKDPANWGVKAANMDAAAVLNTPMNKIISVFDGQTKTMESKWANLSKLSNEAMMQIIVGDKPLDYFDEFVAKWKQIGGDEITREVTDAINK